MLFSTGYMLQIDVQPSFYILSFNRFVEPAYWVNEKRRAALDVVTIIIQIITFKVAFELEKKIITPIFLKLRYKN